MRFPLPQCERCGSVDLSELEDGWCACYVCGRENCVHPHVVGMDLGAGPDRQVTALVRVEGERMTVLTVIDDPWPMARRESSDFPDIDQMLSDIGAVVDSILEDKMKRWFERTIAIQRTHGFDLVERLLHP